MIETREMVAHPSMRTFNFRNPGISRAPFVDETGIASLRKFRRNFEGKTGFPEGWCRDVAEEAEEIFGLALEGGFFLLDRPLYNRGSLVTPHFWNLDRSGAIVGYTESQFNRGLKTPFPPDVVLLKPDNPDYWRFLPANHPIVRTHFKSGSGFF